MKIYKILLICIVILSFAIRFYKVQEIPPGLNLDEVAIGYNAYSILKTGRDEYGEWFPLAFRSHDDYKPPLYIYLTVPSIFIFGLNEIGVRFPSVLVGTLSVLAMYWLVEEILFNKKQPFNTKQIALTGALLLAINPWHIQFSRAAFETNTAMFLVMTGVISLLKGFRSNKKWWFVTSLTFALALYTYQSARLFIPLFLISILFIFFKDINKRLGHAIIASIIFIVLVLPLIPIATSTAGIMRFKGTSVFEHPSIVQEEESRSKIDAQRQDQVAIKLFHNRYLSSIIVVAKGYLAHLNPEVLFFGKGPSYNFTANVGLFYLYEFTFIIWGLHLVLSSLTKNHKLLLIWLCLAPLASALTYDIPSSTRTMLMLPPITLISAYGLSDFLKRSNMLRIKGKFVLISVVIVISASAGYYLHQYMIHSPIEYAGAWQYGYKQTVEYINENYKSFDRIVVSTNLSQPQNFFAFYLQYDPKTYIDVDGGTVSGGFLESKNKFGKYEFHEIDYRTIEQTSDVIIVDLYKKMSEEMRLKQIKTITLPSGEPELVISKT